MRLGLITLWTNLFVLFPSHFDESDASPGHNGKKSWFFTQRLWRISQKTFFCSAISGMCQLWTNKGTLDQSTGLHHVTRNLLLPDLLASIRSRQKHAVQSHKGGRSVVIVRVKFERLICMKTAGRRQGLPPSCPFTQPVQISNFHLRVFQNCSRFNWYLIINSKINRSNPEFEHFDVKMLHGWLKASVGPLFDTGASNNTGRILNSEAL